MAARKRSMPRVYPIRSPVGGETEPCAARGLLGHGVRMFRRVKNGMVDKNCFSKTEPAVCGHVHDKDTALKCYREGSQHGCLRQGALPMRQKLGPRFCLAFGNLLPPLFRAIFEGSAAAAPPTGEKSNDVLPAAGHRRHPPRRQGRKPRRTRLPGDRRRSRHR